MVAGMDAMDWAKMTGRTPDIFTFMGRLLDWPPYIFRPTCRLAYWTGMRRSASLTNTLSTTSSRIPTTIRITQGQKRLPEIMLAEIWETMEGIREMMPANRIMEIPLPTPNSLHCSPSHIRKLEPATKAIMITRAAQMLSLVRMLLLLMIQ